MTRPLPRFSKCPSCQRLNLGDWRCVCGYRPGDQDARADDHSGEEPGLFGGKDCGSG